MFPDKNVLMRFLCAAVATMLMTSETMAGERQQQTPTQPPPQPSSQPQTETKRSAVLAVDMPSQPLALQRCMSLSPRLIFTPVRWAMRIVAQPVCGAPPVLGWFSERVYDKSRTSPLERVSARVDSVAKPGAGFDPNRHLSFRFDNHAADLFSDEGADLRYVEPDGHANINGTVANLEAGEYNVTLRFTAANAAEEDSGKVTLSIFVKDGPLAPLIVVTLGVLVSFLTKRVFVVTRDRLALKERIARQDSAWLRNEPPSSAIVWAQANLRLVRSMVRAAQLAIPDMVTARLADVEALLPTLRAIRDTRKLLDANIRSPLVLARAKDRVAQQSARCSDPPLSAATTQQIAAELASIDAWATSASLPEDFWKDRLRAIRELLATVRVEAITNADAKFIVEKIVSELNEALARKDPPQNVFDLYERYATLEILWQQRDHAQTLNDLVDACTHNRPIVELFRITDDASWNRLTELVKAGRAMLAVPAVKPQAFEPFTIRVTTDDPEVNDSFLFKFKLRYVWKIELRSRRWWKPWAGETAFATLTPESLEPSVQQFARRMATAAASVTIRNGSECVSIQAPASFEIETSDVVGLVGAMGRVETYPLIIAAIIAVLTGISTQYAGNATFGSTKDYLTLFLWGAAVDLVKNVVQPTTSAAPAAPGAPPAPAATAKPGTAPASK